MQLVEVLSIVPLIAGIIGAGSYMRDFYIGRHT
jgi:hypothetical protein